MIKKAFSIVAIAAFMMTASCEKNLEPKMEFAEKEFDFGTITQGDKVQHVFTFKNTGSEDLQIKHAQGSCGCTVPDYPREAIKPGEEGSIKVSFNSAHKLGSQHKTVTLEVNTKEGSEILNIKAEVNPNPNKPAEVSGIAAPASISNNQTQETKTK
ncbi:DUF1573 domain-containing protein [Flavobacterium sp. 3HN19-14]|uniref:DUF1573 domain-containing protein n=1 Tax=Flavobacterium sp. 3HN19-14 TaxID=3448133 RepID=UPI003EDF6BC8